MSQKDYLARWLSALSFAIYPIIVAGVLQQ
jgi:hypothetical protein